MGFAGARRKCHPLCKVVDLKPKGYARAPSPEAPCMSSSPALPRTALVTDVCHFVGRSSALALQADGFHVFAQDESFTAADARTAFEAETPGVTALTAQSGPDLRAALADHGVDALDALINNDAFPAERMKLEDASANDMRRTLEALVVTPFERTGALIPAMKARGRGSVVLVTSAAPFRGLPNYSMYVTARGAANALTRSLAMELAPFGIRVNAVAPNFIESPTYFPPALMENPDTRDRILKNIPLGRLGQQGEAAATVAFLAGDGAGFMTGHVLPLAGGWA